MPTCEFDQELREKILTSLRLPRLRIERGLLLTASYRETEGEPMPVRRAKALLKYAQEIPIAIAEWQLIVGGISAGNFSLAPFPESTCSWIPEIETLGTRDGDKYFVAEEDREPLRETLGWWKGKSIEDNVLRRIPPDVATACAAVLIRSAYVELGSGNFMPDYRRVLREGLRGISDDIELRLATLDLAKPDDYAKTHFYQAGLICCEAVRTYASRFAALARAQAAATADEARRIDLLRIARNCERAPWYPAEDMSEALQGLWLLHCLLHWDAAGGAAIVLGRFDQYLFPLYARFQAERGPAETKRWLVNFWINQNQLMYFLPKRSTAMIWSGHPMSEQPTIGGVTEEGRDATNDLSKLLLDIEREVGLPRPDITVMYHKDIDPELLHKAAQSLPVATKPKFFNYEILQKHLLAKGVKEDEARKGGVVIGCVSAGVEGKVWGNNQMSFVNMAKILELALSDGVDQITGQQVGPKTGRPETFHSFDDLLAAFTEQLEHAVRMAAILAIVVEQVHRELNPQPLVSLLTEDCVARGRMVWEGGARYSIPGLVGVGLANVADSLAAVKKLVFEERLVGLDDVCKALKDDWDGHELLRQRAIQKVPKYGNDEDYVDELAVRVARLYCNAVLRHSSPRDVPYYPGLYSVSAHVGLGEYVAATPDGRRARAPLADGMSPVQGMVKNGPTAILHSMTKVDQAQASSGTLQNMKFSRAAIERHEDKFIATLRTYMALGGYHVQFNIYDTATLVDAQQHPERYAGMIVRVAAYAAEFIGLPKALQDDIIQRSELGLG